MQLTRRRTRVSRTTRDYLHQSGQKGQCVYRQNQRLKHQDDGFHVHSEEDLSFSVFYHFIKRKKQFIFQRDIPDTSCLCEVCENAAMYEEHM